MRLTGTVSGGEFSGEDLEVVAKGWQVGDQIVGRRCEMQTERKQQANERRKCHRKRVGSSWRRRGVHRVEERRRTELIRVEELPEWVEAMKK
ncbi:hypothetical protein AVEN_198650-1 [Araneus ventricosus]|uniref:Uncharacterized protein n=1 Tax=Araneus ventricosus TaxID=182803 RepID=A0A4Y2QMM6_ARAVE|nr:hypothetical protein AVEN_198650-1 [Araneus ventricosus]